MVIPLNFMGDPFNYKVLGGARVIVEAMEQWAMLKKGGEWRGQGRAVEEFEHGVFVGFPLVYCNNLTR